jgi:hypothetical protein
LMPKMPRYTPDQSQLPVGDQKRPRPAVGEAAKR